MDDQLLNGGERRDRAGEDAVAGQSAVPDEEWDQKQRRAGQLIEIGVHRRKAPEPQRGGQISAHAQKQDPADPKPDLPRKQLSQRREDAEQPAEPARQKEARAV